MKGVGEGCRVNSPWPLSRLGPPGKCTVCRYEDIAVANKENGEGVEEGCGVTRVVFRVRIEAFYPSLARINRATIAVNRTVQSKARDPDTTVRNERQGPDSTRDMHRVEMPGRAAVGGDHEVSIRCKQAAVERVGKVDKLHFGVAWRQRDVPPDTIVLRLCRDPRQEDQSCNSNREPCECRVTQGIVLTSVRNLTDWS